MVADVHVLAPAPRRARAGEAPLARDFIKRAEAAAKVAAEFAEVVDRDGRFPSEAFEALREHRLLGMLIPVELGGEGARAADVADVCAILGAACSSTGMIFAMHQVKLACLVRHDKGNAWQCQFQRDAAANQWLLASSTTEGANGGDVRSSEAPIRLEGARAFVRHASRSSGGRMPPGVAHLTRARVTLETLRGAVQSGLATFERSASEPGGLSAMNAQLALNFLKVEASELAASTVMSAMRACGLSGYRNDTEFSMGRYLRDILSAPIMINNDRILANSEAAVLMSEPPLWLAM